MLCWCTCPTDALLSTCGLRSPASLPAPHGPSAHADVGPRERNGRACPLHHRHRHRCLLLRPAQPVAARQQREHQWFASSVLPERRGPQHLHTRRSRRGGQAAQRSPSTNAGMDETLRDVQSRCCVDHVRAPDQVHHRHHAHRDDPGRRPLLQPARDGGAVDQGGQRSHPLDPPFAPPLPGQ